MKVIRRLCLRGNALYVSVPRARAERLGWSVGEPLAVEAIGPNSVRVRPADVADMSTATIPPMNIVLPKASGE